MCDQGREGMGRGWSRPTEGRLEILFWAQTEQANTNCLTSWPMEGHQNRWRMAASDLLTPGWQVTLDSWPHWRTSGRSASGTNNRPAGHSTGTSTPRPALSTLCSMSQERAPTTTPSESMASAGVSSPGRSNWRESVSGLTFLDPGRYERVKSKRSKKSLARAQPLGRTDIF